MRSLLLLRLLVARTFARRAATKIPAVNGHFHPFGTFRSERGRGDGVEFSNCDNDGYLVIAAVQWLEVAR